MLVWPLSFVWFLISQLRWPFIRLWLNLSEWLWFDLAIVPQLLVAMRVEVSFRFLKIKSFDWSVLHLIMLFVGALECLLARKTFLWNNRGMLKYSLRLDFLCLNFNRLFDVFCLNIWCLLLNWRFYLWLFLEWFLSLCLFQCLLNIGL